jgi:DNA polymerase-3 subunit epsilon
LSVREIVLDTETTGLDPLNGDRVVEIACVELANYIPSGRSWHSYLNPQRDMPEAAFRIHGLSAQFLSDKPLFADIAAEFLAFIDGAQVVIHNAAFDLAFLNAELVRAGMAPLSGDRVVDTLSIARRKHPGAQNSLDALCRRYQIDLSARERHSAVVDCELLARVYLELTGRRQAKLELGVAEAIPAGTAGERAGVQARPQPLPARLTPEDAAAHAAFVAGLGANAPWARLLKGGAGEDDAAA